MNANVWQCTELMMAKREMREQKKETRRRRRRRRSSYHRRRRHRFEVYYNWEHQIYIHLDQIKDSLSSTSTRQQKKTHTHAMHTYIARILQTHGAIIDMIGSNSWWIIPDYNFASSQRHFGAHSWTVKDTVVWISCEAMMRRKRSSPR